MVEFMSNELEQIKAQAPEGATHYFISIGHAWYFKNPKNWKVYYRHEWMTYSKLGFGFDLSEMHQL